MSDSDAASRLRLLLVRVAPLAAVSAAFAHAISIGWGRWGELIAETGRELELPRRIASGERLYADLRWYYGPVAPHLNALLYRVFGVHVDVLVFAGIATAALSALAVYLLAQRHAGRALATAVAVAFTYVCAFGLLGNPSMFNFALPYTYAATYGMTAALWSLELLSRHSMSGRAAPFATSVALLAVAALTKMEPFVAALAAHATFAVGALAARRLGRLHVGGWAAAAVVTASVYFGLSVAVGPTLWSDNLGGVVNAGSRTYVAVSMGLVDPGGATRLAILSALLLAATLTVGGLLGRTLSRRRGAVGASAAAFAAAAVAFVAYRAFGVRLGAPCLPFLCAGALIVVAVRFVRHPELRPVLLPRAVIAAFACAALARIVLRCTLDHYGFYLLPAALVSVALLAAAELPELFAVAPATRTAIVASATGILLGLAAGSWSISRPAYEARTLELDTPRGRLWIRADTGGRIAAVVTRLASYPANTRVLAVPMGVGMTFLAGQPSAGHMFSYFPMELADSRVEADLIRRCSERPADVVVFVPADMREFGYRGFGLDYAVESRRFLSRTYSPVARIGEVIIAERAR